MSGVASTRPRIKPARASIRPERRSPPSGPSRRGPDILRRRQEWFDDQLDLDPARLVFIDETWASTNMARRYGRALRGQRLRASVPHGHWKTTTFVAGLRLTGLVAPFVLDGPINRDAFEVYVEKVLVPELRLGDVVVMDNLSSPQGAKRASADRGRRSDAALPAALQSRLQPDRECLRQTKAAPAQGRRADHRW